MRPLKDILPEPDYHTIFVCVDVSSFAIISIIIQAFITCTHSATILNWRHWQSLGLQHTGSH